MLQVHNADFLEVIDYRLLFLCSVQLYHAGYYDQVHDIAHNQDRSRKIAEKSNSN